MFLFLRLIVAHFLADFFLQTKEVYRAKARGLGGAMLHYAIVFLTLVVFAFPFLQFFACWMVILLAATAHIIFDEIKFKISSSKTNVVVFLADQALHVLSLAPILFFDFAHKAVDSHTGFMEWYNNNTVQVALLAYLISVFTGAYLWQAIVTSSGEAIIPQMRLRFGMLERGIITTSLLSVYFFPLLVVPAVRLIVNKTRLNRGEIIFNISFASCIGLWLRYQLARI